MLFEVELNQLKFTGREKLTSECIINGYLEDEGMFPGIEQLITMLYRACIKFARFKKENK